MSQVQSAVEQIEQSQHALARSLDRETEECAELVEGYLAAARGSGVAYNIPLALRARIEERKCAEPISAIAHTPASED